jgi:octaprenyl-diphosphate synthase
VKSDQVDNLSAATSAVSLVSADLARVEARIAEVISAREPKLTEISDYLINAGGKRIRPAVSMLVFRACGGTDVTDVVDLSVALELIHTATLLHDDIIDSNDVRRGKQAAPLRFGMADTLVTGDFLFSRAFQVCGRFEERIVTWAAEACIGLTEGEIMQGRYRRNGAVREEHYFEIIQRKTASLFEAGARIAAWLATQNEEKTATMATCGNEIGLAFQMIDDVLDVVGEADRIGKRVGTDLLDGNPSLPVVWGLQLPAVRYAFEREGISDDELYAAINALRDAGVPRRVRDAAIAHAENARTAVAGLQPSPYRDALLSLVAELVDREV